MKCSPAIAEKSFLLPEEPVNEEDIRVAFAREQTKVDVGNLATERLRHAPPDKKLALLKSQVFRLVLATSIWHF